MRLDCRRHESLPRLSWCAHLREGDDRVSLLHGPWVETREDWFVAGAWDGAFDRGRFDLAPTLLGSGGRATAEGLLLCTASDLVVPLYALRGEAGLWVSNSLVFLLVRAGESLDPRYPHYVDDLAEQRRWGLSRRDSALPTSSGNGVVVHAFTNLAISPDLTVRPLPKASGAEPRNFSEYDRLLNETIAAVTDNASDANRSIGYRPVSMISRGYDSVASTALAARVGCKEAITFAKLDPDDRYPDDGGSQIAALFGMQTREYSRLAFKRLPGLPEAEFCACPNGSYVQMAVLDDQLEGALLFEGTFGDAIWHLDPREHPPQLKRLRRGMWRTLIGTSAAEFRLRVGFIAFPVPYIGAVHHQKICKIANSREMQPWRIGGSYDRPIPRRIAEEAGVPRDWFGQVKQAGLHYHFYRHGLLPQSQADFAQYYESTRRTESLPQRLRFGAMRALYAVCAAGVKTLNALGDVFGWRTVFPVPVHGRYETAVDPLQFSFHWGTDRIRDRYEVARHVEGSGENSESAFRAVGSGGL